MLFAVADRERVGICSSERPQRRKRHSQLAVVGYKWKIGCRFKFPRFWRELEAHVAGLRRCCFFAAGMATSSRKRCAQRSEVGEEGKNKRSKQERCRLNSAYTSEAFTSKLSKAWR